MKRFSAKNIQIEHWPLEKLTSYFVVLALAIGMVGTYYWYNKLYMTNERRFWSSIDRAMSIDSVVRTTGDGGTGNKQTVQSRLNFGSEALIENKTTVSERGATANSEVVTDGYINLREQLVRYSKIETSEMRPDGTDYDFTAILNKWATDKTEGEDGAMSDERRLNYLQEHIYLAPFGNFNAEFRKELLRDLREGGAYIVEHKNATENERDGVKYTDYSVRISTKKYVAVLQKALQKAGLGEFPPLNPDNYDDVSRINATFAINASNGNLAGISYNDRQEVYSDHGVKKEYSLPKAELSIDELQGLLQQVQ